MTHFDPYHEWLGIPSAEQPPNYYRLLGIDLFECSERVIANAADRQMLFVRQFQTGEHLSESQTILNQIAAAKVCLLNPASKDNYDISLRQSLVSEHYEQVPTSTNLILDQNVPDADSLITSTHTSHVRSSPRKNNSIRVIGHILASLIGIVAGFVILHWMRTDRSEPVVARETPSVTEKTSEATSPPTHEPAIEQSNPFDLGKDSAIQAQETLPTIAQSEVIPSAPAPVPPQSVKVNADRLKAERTHALAQGELSKALALTGELAQLDEKDVIQSKFEFLLTLNEDAFEKRSVVEQMLVLLNEGIESKHESTQKIAEAALATARQTNDSALIRKATLGVLKSQNLTLKVEGDSQ